MLGLRCSSVPGHFIMLGLAPLIALVELVFAAFSELSVVAARTSVAGAKL